MILTELFEESDFISTPKAYHDWVTATFQDTIAPLSNEAKELFLSLLREPQVYPCYVSYTMVKPPATPMNAVVEVCTIKSKGCPKLTFYTKADIRAAISKLEGML